MRRRRESLGRLLPGPAVRALAKRHGIPPSFPLAERLEAIARRHLCRRQRYPTFVAQRQAARAELERAAETGCVETAYVAVTVALERTRERRRAPRSATPLPVRAAARRALREPTPPGRVPEWALRTVYRELGALYEDATGRRPYIPQGRPRGAAWRFLADAVALLQAAGVEARATGAAITELRRYRAPKPATR